MADVAGMVRQAYEHWDAGDVDALLGLFHDDARFFVPGTTPVSGDVDKDGFRSVLATVNARLADGSHVQEVICTYAGDDGASSTIHNHVARDGTDLDYHSIHHWQVRDGKFSYWWLFLHEYDQFQAAWA